MTIRLEHPARLYLSCKHSRRVFVAAAVAMLALHSAGPAAAQTENGVIVSQGLAFYYALIPAEMIRGHSKEHPEASMHGGVPSRPHAHHVMVALFDAKSFDRVVNASVTASLGEIGFSGTEKMLEPFVVDSALTYGNYFDLRPGTEYLARISATIPGRKSPARAEFQFKH
jgi:hypothetical protein